MGSKNVNIIMWNPLSAIAPFALLTLSIPLAVFAILTTSIAISLLSLRALVVYFQLATALIVAWLSPPSSKRVCSATRTLPPNPFEQTSPSRHLSRRASNASQISQDTTTLATRSIHLPKKSDSLTALVGTNDITRDFEGVGGWRVPGDDEEEALWMGVTPTETSTRRHQRSLTGGASPSQRWNFGPDALRMSPVQSRARTPLRFALDDENGYFPPQPASNNVKQHARRKSGSNSSTSSTCTATGMMVFMKETGE